MEILQIRNPKKYLTFRFPKVKAACYSSHSVLENTLNSFTCFLEYNPQSGQVVHSIWPLIQINLTSHKQSNTHMIKYRNFYQFSHAPWVYSFSKWVRLSTSISSSVKNLNQARSEAEMNILKSWTLNPMKNAPPQTTIWSDYNTSKEFAYLATRALLTKPHSFLF